ncbi:serine hydrolase [Streptosporangiaceae bacterium NEAU-GS5]|nr:serine hydrolase [Streptosporangiaceae bacterium NEAU-GS5]
MERAGVMAVLSAGALLLSGCGSERTLAAEPGPSASLAAEPASQPAPQLTPEMVDAAIGKLDSIVNEVMNATGVPGMAVAVVYKDKVPYMKGFGVRRVGSPQVVDPDTVFPLASVSKPLASTVVAGVAGQKAISWDDPVKKYTPGFKLKDPWVSAHVTIADLFAHRSGLPDHAGDELENLGYDLGYILGHLRYQPLSPFRADYAYTNFGLTAAAVAVAAAKKTTWEDLSADVLYRPLGMNSTSSSFADYMKAANRASLHVDVNGRWVPKYTRDPDAQSPAGGASSSVRDMTLWMRLQLGNGKFNGRQFIDAAALDQTHLPQNSHIPPPAPWGRPSFYGLGWNVGYDELGRLRLNHSGGFELGAATTVTLLPTEQLGIVVLTNSQPIGVPETVAESFFDIAQNGRMTVAWLPFFNGLFAQMDGQGQAPADYARPPANATRAKPDSAYVGRYGNDYYGPLTVTGDNGSLTLTLGPKNMRFPLTHYDGDTFSFPTRGETATGLCGVIFTAASSGHAAKARVECLDHNGLGTFTRH